MYASGGAQRHYGRAIEPLQRKAPVYQPAYLEPRSLVNSALAYLEARDRYRSKGPMKEEKHA